MLQPPKKHLFDLEAETLDEATAAPGGRSDLKFGEYIYLK